MPYDGSGFQPNRIVAILDQLRAAFGPHGEHWIKGKMVRTSLDRIGYCMLGAMHFKVDLTIFETREVIDLLAATVPIGGYLRPVTGATLVMQVNDDRRTTFPMIEQWLQRAREMALQKETV